MLAAERDLLAAQLAEQKELLKKTQKEAEEAEATPWPSSRASAPPGLTRRQCWPPASTRSRTSSTVSFFAFLLRAADYMSSRLLVFFDLLFIISVLADFFPGHSQVTIQAIEADH